MREADRAAPLPIDRKARLGIPPQSPTKRPACVRVFDFCEVSLGYDPAGAVAEAERCIQCPTPAPCQQACPLHNDIPLALWHIAAGDFDRAAAVFRQTSPLSEVCGRVCPQEVLCQGSCTVGRRDLPVHIGRLEAFVADWQRSRTGFPLPAPVTPTGRRAAIVGSGPAGLAAAEELARRGHGVTVFEAWPRPGGLLVYGIPGFKLDKQIVEEKIAFLESIGVQFVCSTLVGWDLSVDDLFEREGFDAVFLGTGAPVGTALGIPGEDLTGVYQASDLLVRANLPPEMLPESMRQRPRVGKNVMVIGGGDTAMDCVRSAKRLQRQNGIADSRVTCVYRRTEKEMPGVAEERANARDEGVIFEYLTAPVQFFGDDAGNLRAVELTRMRLGEPDATGRRRPIPVDGSNLVTFVDTVVCALGYGADPLVPETTDGLQVNRWGLFVVDPETGATSRPGVYAGGDNVTGADLVVTALAAGLRAARAMDQTLSPSLGACLRGLPEESLLTFPVEVRLNV